MSIRLERVTKIYAQHPVVHDVSLDVEDGEFFVLLGPSGSGKSTLLRSIAGLLAIDEGRIYLRGQDISELPTRKRGVGFVFQNYALFRHLTVAENIEFALRVQRVRAAERRARRKELLRLVALEGLDDRVPAELSGGQQQRVAVARALAHRPGVLLLDEPFGALDARIREELRQTIRAVQRELGITTVLVTHDQEEAFSLADRIGVMHQGRLLECAAPEKLYQSPRTRFVATFLGAANLLLATSSDPRFGQQDALGETVVVIRPEDLEVATSDEHLASPLLTTGSVIDTSFSGPVERVTIRPDGGNVEFAIASDDPEVLLACRTLQERRNLPLRPGERVAVGYWRTHALPTPISSISILGATAADCEGLRRSPLLDTLVERMRLRVELRPETIAPDPHAPERLPRRGIHVMARTAPEAAITAQLTRSWPGGALLLDASTPVPRRVYIYWSDESTRDRALASAASLLRHMPADPTCIGLLQHDTSEPVRNAVVRDLLAGQAHARVAHGLETRTELISLMRDPSAAETFSDRDTLVVIGVRRGLAPDSNVRALLASGTQPVLLVTN
jgi:sulfate transport system ATP-binding protein